MFPSRVMILKLSKNLKSRHSEATKKLCYVLSTHWRKIPIFLGSSSRTISEPLKLSLINLILNKIINNTFVAWIRYSLSLPNDFGDYMKRIIVLPNCFHYNRLIFFNYLFIFCNMLNGLGPWVFIYWRKNFFYLHKFRKKLWLKQVSYYFLII